MLFQNHCCWVVFQSSYSYKYYVLGEHNKIGLRAQQVAQQWKHWNFRGYCLIFSYDESSQVSYSSSSGSDNIDYCYKLWYQSDGMSMHLREYLEMKL